MIDRETLGKVVRLAWVAWAAEQPNPKSSWLRPWEELSETDREADRRIGELTANFALSEYNPLNRYQEEVKRTTATTELNDTLVMTAMGLSGEVGEINEQIRKYLFHCHLLNRDDIAKECSYLLWYLTALCAALGVSLQDVIDQNVKNLRRRYPAGFDAERSKNREKNNE